MWTPGVFLPPIAHLETLSTWDSLRSRLNAPVVTKIKPMHITDSGLRPRENVTRRSQPSTTARNPSGETNSRLPPWIRFTSYVHLHWVTWEATQVSAHRLHTRPDAWQRLAPESGEHVYRAAQLVDVSPETQVRQ